jgi:type IV pilus assembly protein PilA
MKHLRKRGGFTLIELLVVILILAVLMAIALPLYLRAVRDSQRQTCRSNMQTIANAEQAYKVRSTGHVYTTDLTELIGPDQDLQATPRCPNDDSVDATDDYVVIDNGDGSITIRCNCSDADAAAFHNTVASDPGNTTHGFTPGVDAE